MRIGIIGAGNIGKTLVRELSAAGHDVKIANSRGPETIDAEILAMGGRAVSTADALVNVEVAILSIPLIRLPEIAPLIAELPGETVVIDTSNYYPHRDGRIAAIGAGQVESEWVQEQLGRPVVKAWNAIGAHSFADRGKPAGSPERIALPIAADREADRDVAFTLVNESGLDPFDAGPISESWRQQPGTPCYCTDITREQMPAALAAAEAARSPTRRDIGIAAVVERIGEGISPSAEYLVRLNRALFM